MYIRTVFLLFIPCFFACQQNPEEITSLSCKADYQAVTASLKTPEKAPESAANIVFRSVDGGQTWQDVSTGLPKDLAVGCIYADGNQVVLGSEKGLYYSSTGSATPEWEKDFFPGERITNISSGPSGPYYCSYGNGFFQIIPGTGIALSKYNTLTDKTIRTILETPDGALLVGCDSGIFKSADGGKTWKRVFDGGLVLDIVASGGVLIAGGMKGVLRSTNGGEHWEPVLNENILAKKTGIINGRFVTILGTEDASKINPLGITSRLRVSNDGGKTWERMERPLLPLQGVYDMDWRLSDVLDIYDIVQVGENLFCSFDTGIYRSSDQGKTWDPVLPTKGRLSFNLAVSGQVIYAVTGAGGC